MSDTETTLDRLILKAGQLYSLPAVAMEVLDLTSNPQVDTRALKECIENDPALTGHFFPNGLSEAPAHPDQAMPLLLGKVVPAGLLGVLVAGLMAAFMSTHDSYFLCWSSVIARDVIAPLKKRPLTDKEQIRTTRMMYRMCEMGILDIWMHKEGGNFFGPLAPGGYAPSHPAESTQWSQWARYIRTAGRTGWEPPERIKEIERMFNAMVTAPSPWR